MTGHSGGVLDAQGCRSADSRNPGTRSPGNTEQGTDSLGKGTTYYMRDRNQHDVNTGGSVIVVAEGATEDSGTQATLTTSCATGSQEVFNSPSDLDLALTLRATSPALCGNLAASQMDAMPED